MDLLKSRSKMSYFRLLSLILSITPGAGEGGCDDLGDSFLLLLSGMSSSQTISTFLFPSFFIKSLKDGAILFIELESFADLMASSNIIFN